MKIESEGTHATAATTTGNGNAINIVLPERSAQDIVAALNRSSLISGISIALAVIMTVLFYRAEAQSELEVYQFNLLRNCLETKQCDVQAVLNDLKNGDSDARRR